MSDQTWKDADRQRSELDARLQQIVPGDAQRYKLLNAIEEYVEALMANRLDDYEMRLRRD